MTPVTSLTLRLLPGDFAVCRLRSDAALPAWAARGEFWSLTMTDDELSVVVTQSAVPDGVRAEMDWACLQVAGPLELTMTGVLAAVTAPLAQAGISVFVICTFDTDYLLVKRPRLAEATAALAGAGHTVLD
jgi:hypothetical protein